MGTTGWERLEPVSEREHRRRWGALHRLAAALGACNVRSHVYAAPELSAPHSLWVDYRVRRDPFLTVQVAADKPELCVRVCGETYVWQDLAGQAVECPIGDPTSAARQLLPTPA